MTDGKALRLALRASTALPVLAGRPVALGGRRYFDAGLAESIPYRQALRDGATHVLVLRSKAVHDVPATKGAEERVPPSLGARFVAKVALRRHTPQLKAAYLARRARMVDDDRDLAAYEMANAGALTSAVVSIRPDPNVPPVSRLATDSNLLQEAFEFGRRAVNSWFGPTECETAVGSDLLTA
jgi:predicted patatin/cPLA2 family phospholipase